MIFRSYLKSAYRNILRHKLFSAINILGLSIGLAAVMLIALFVRDELSYDNFWKDADNIYRVHIRSDVPGKDPEYFNTVSSLVAEALKRDFSEINQIARVVRNRQKITYKNVTLDLEASLVDPEILEIFDFKAVYGNLETALNDANSLILDHSQSIKIFGEVNPIGETVTLEYFAYSKDYKITAVVEDNVKNSVLSIKGMSIINLDDFEGRQLNFWQGWYNHFVSTYVAFAPGTNIADIDARIDDFIDQNYPLSLLVPQEQNQVLQ